MRVDYGTQKLVLLIAVCIGIVLVLTPYRKLDIGIVIRKPVCRVALFGREILCMLEEHVFEFSFRVDFKQLLAEIHIRENRSKRSARF